MESGIENEGVSQGLELNGNDETVAENEQGSHFVPEVNGQARQGRPKRGRKRKVLEQSRADRKRLCNTNKTHINCMGNRVEEKVFDENFVCACPKKCTSIVKVELRKRLFTQFQSMGTFEGRCAFIVGCVIEIPKKQPSMKSNMNRIFSMFGHEVCKIAFIRTLQINESRVTVALHKHMNCDTYSDGRGQTSGGHNALPLWKRDEVRKHIESFPKYVSHYTRNQTDSKFLNSELNLAKMYELYKSDHANPVSKTFYKKTFYRDFNLRFKVPKKDTCKKCDVYFTKMKTSSAAERLVIEEWHNEHLDQADSLRKQMNDDLAMAKINKEVETWTFDIQKTLPLPKIPTNIAYYKRKLNMYNLGIHIGSTADGVFNIWLEHEASKGTQEVGSCLKKNIEMRICQPVKKLILWSDSCGGQNRSIKLVLMMIHVLQNHCSLESITIRYLQSGHSFLPNDTEFGDAECSLKQFERLYTDYDYTKIMSSSRSENPFYIERMCSDDFLSVKQLEQATINRKVDINKAKINWLETHEILLEKSEPFIIKMKKKVDGVFQSVNIKRRGPPIELKNIELEELWPMGKPLSKEKVSDLKDLLELVEDQDKYFYAFLNHVPTSEFIDDVDGFGENIDFVLEE